MYLEKTDLYCVVVELKMCVVARDIERCRLVGRRLTTYCQGLLSGRDETTLVQLDAELAKLLAWFYVDKVSRWPEVTVVFQRLKACQVACARTRLDPVDARLVEALQDRRADRDILLALLDNTNGLILQRLAGKFGDDIDLLTERLTSMEKEGLVCHTRMASRTLVTTTGRGQRIGQVLADNRLAEKNSVASKQVDDTVITATVHPPYRDVRGQRRAGHEFSLFWQTLQ